jgi:hypothetical protein
MEQPEIGRTSTMQWYALDLLYNTAVQILTQKALHQVRRYDNPTFDPYMEHEYQRLVVGPAKRVRQVYPLYFLYQYQITNTDAIIEVRQAHQEGGKPTEMDAAMSGQLEGAEDAVRSLDRYIHGQTHTHTHTHIYVYI